MNTKITSLAPLITEAERTIAAACSHFKLKVPPSAIVVTIQTRGREKNAVGWFWADRWSKKTVGSKEETVLHEINLSAELVSTHDMGELILHELAHAENNHNKIEDCTDNGRHNKKFKSQAEALGLKVNEKSHPKVGFGVTELAEPGTKFLEAIKFDKALFAAHRLEPHKRGKVGSRLIKLECSCGWVARASQKCIDMGLPTCCCGEEFEVAS